MSYKLKHFDKFSDLLEPGEEYLVAAIGLPPGGTRRVMAGAGAGGALGMILAGRGKDTKGTIELPRQFVLALTNRRLSFFSVGGMGMLKPKEALFAIPLEDIKSVTMNKSGAASRQATFELRDQPPLVVEFQKGIQTGAWAKELVERIQPLLAGPTT